MAVYPYCWVWCCLSGDFTMFDRAVEEESPPEACYFDERLDRWVLFYELPADQRALILDPSLWDQIEALHRADAPTRKDVGLGPASLSPAVLAALSHPRCGARVGVVPAAPAEPGDPNRGPMVVTSASTPDRQERTPPRRSGAA